MNDSERLERYLDDFGAQLTSAAGPTGAPRPNRRRYAFATAIALATVAVMTIGLLASSERLDPIAEARAALAPPGEIVYMKVTSQTISPGASSVPSPQTTEQWSATDPLRWRYVMNMRGGGMGTVIGGRDVPITRQEMSYGAGVLRHYLAEPDRLTVTSGFGDDDSAAHLPAALGQGSGDPEADLRTALFSGSVTDRGELQLAGRTVRRFVVERRRRAANDPPTSFRLVYDVDARTFAPIEGRMSLWFGSHAKRPRVTTRMHVDAYKRIPLNATTARLLRIKTTPRTTATFDTKQKQRAREQAWRAKCRPIQNGRGLACPTPAGIAPKPAAKGG